MSENSISIWALVRTLESVSRKKGARADTSFVQLGLNSESSSCCLFPLSCFTHTKPPLSGYTYTLPRVLDNVVCLDYFHFYIIFPWRFCCFLFQTWHEDLRLAWSPWHLKRQCSPGRGNVGDVWSQRLRSHPPWAILEELEYKQGSFLVEENIHDCSRHGFFWCHLQTLRFESVHRKINCWFWMLLQKKPDQFLSVPFWENLTIYKILFQTVSRKQLINKACPFQEWLERAKLFPFWSPRQCRHCTKTEENVSTFMCFRKAKGAQL